jgi:hypothetical protein
LVTLAACASDGGVGGTGIATVRGNVIDPELTAVVQDAQLAGLGASAAGITVRVRGTAVADETDAGGFFELSGAIAGEITLEFTRDDRPVATAAPVFVPVDAEVTLKDVALLGDVAQPDVVELDNVIAIVVEPPSCNPDGSGTFRLRDDGELEFAMHVTPDTVITNSRGEIGCADVTERSELKFRGVQEDGTIVATDVRVIRESRRSLP